MRVNDDKPAPTGKGWKVLMKSGTGHRTPYFCFSTPVGVWLIAVGDTIPVLGSDGIYPSGFHLFENEWDARSYGLAILGGIVREVEYRGAHTRGVDESGHMTIVASEMRVMRRRKKANRGKA